MKRNVLAILVCAALAASMLTGCAGQSGTSSDSKAGTTASSSGKTTTTFTANANGILDTSDLFSDRDLEQEADLSNAQSITVSSGNDITIADEGVYVLSGTAENVTITVDADSSSKVQLVLDGLTIKNTGEPAIYVASADKVFITTAPGSKNSLSATGDFTMTTDSGSDIDGVIFAKDDIVLNGLGSLTIESSENGIVGKDDVKVTGGTYAITAGNHGIQGKDSVRIAAGTFTIDAGKDGIHSANDDDPTLGYVYIADGTFNVKAASDGIEGDAAVQIDGGTFTIDAEEGIEGTFVQINGGTIDITATDDGINASDKSTAYTPTIEINGGDISIDMGQGDTDALDSNGSLIINGGTIDITAQFAFDFVTQGTLNGGTVTVNGEQVSEITNSMMEGPGSMGPQGGMSGMQGAPQGGMQGGPQGGMR